MSRLKSPLARPEPDADLCRFFDADGKYEDTREHNSVAYNSDASPVSPPDVPDTCLLDPLIRFACALAGGQDSDPCSRCNEDRSICHGRLRVR